MDEKIPEFYIGTAANVSSEGVRILFDGQTEATEKRYKILNTGVQVASGDRVIVAKISGSYVVLGKISYDQSGGGGSSGIYVKKSGDEMTGDLDFLSGKSPLLDAYSLKVGTRPASNLFANPISFRDKVKTLYAKLQGIFLTDGRVGTQLLAIRSISGTDYENRVSLFLDESGNSTVNVTAPDAWCEGIGAVKKSGDTMTGTLAFDLPDKDGTVKIQPVPQGSGAAQGLLIQGATGLIIGGGESPTNAYNADLNSLQTAANEDLVLLSDRKIIGYVNCNTIANAIKAFEILATGEINLYAPLSISSGGTGQNSVTPISTISDILSPFSGISVTSAQFATFGKVAQLRFVFSKSAAVTSGNTNIATLVSGKTPVFNALATCHTNHDLVAYVNANGNVVVNGPIAANTSYTVYSTYILA